ncbi:MAG: site-2 protease family protein [Candidatus Margulisbacteria bacterium]|nr:site-2 protease family protein [Candidatus Margulisiibacteriota bacterium]
MFDPYFLLISLPILLVTITIHEFAHAMVADRLGDPTPRLAGRLTLNPISHIDPIGLLMLILVRFGWAKPVPINPYNFQDIKRGVILVSLAGPLSNFFTAWILAVALRTIPQSSFPIVGEILNYAVWINLALSVFNLIPIPPLDGSKIFEGFLPYQQAEFLRQNGLFILILFILFGSPLLFTIVDFIYRLLI